MRYVISEELGFVARRLFCFYNIDVTVVAEFGIGVSTRTLGAVPGAEKVGNSNMTTTDTFKAPSKIIYIDHNFVTSFNDSEMIT